MTGSNSSMAQSWVISDGAVAEVRRGGAPTGNLPKRRLAGQI